MTSLIERIGLPVALESETPAGVDDVFMRRALELAWRGAGRTHPNPLVGAVVVAGGETVGEGYHRRCGEAHAETSALAAAGERALGATMYVTLEPCVHFGRTPPCTDAIIGAGISRVVIPALDPDTRVFGRGVEALRRAGIQVDIGAQSRAAVVQNIGYYRSRLGMGSAVTLKMAVSMDGKIASAPGRRDLITGTSTQRYVHGLRAVNDCVVVGVETAIVDAPVLDCRKLPPDRRPEVPPVPVVLDTHLRLPPANNWSRAGRNFVVICGRDADGERRRKLEAGGATVIASERDGDGVSIPAVVEALDALGMRRILVEGGSRVFTSFVGWGHWDALYLFQSAKLFGDAGVPMYRGPRTANGIVGHVVDNTTVGDDSLHRFFGNDSWRSISESVGR